SNTRHSFYPNSARIPRDPKAITRAQSKNDDSADGPDRLISAITYFYPFFDGIQYGKYVITQFSPIQTLIQPLVPAIRVFKSFPLNGEEFQSKRWVRLTDDDFDNCVFIFWCLYFGFFSSCLLGQLPRLPIVAEAADRQHHSDVITIIRIRASQVTAIASYVPP
ncbi:hypothetical protein HAX54_050755, partial [Datura stramonium]|nr:hypothetical protein [Datura stramonium]